MDKYKELEELVLSIKKDISKFYDKQNNEAGIRIRRALRYVKIIAQEIRLDITAKKRK